MIDDEPVGYDGHGAPLYAHQLVDQPTHLEPENTMKIYLAAPYAARDILKDHLPFWADAGHEVTCGWVRGTRPLGTASYGISAMSTDEEVTAHAEMDLADIDAADAVVHYTAQYLQSLDPSLGDKTHNLHSGGRHTETGYALAKGKPVIIIGPMENIFQRGLCLTAMDLDGALQALELVAEFQAR